MNFKTVFDAAEDGYGAWWFPTIGLLFVFIGWLQVFRPILVARIFPYGVQGLGRKILGWFLFVFSLFWTVISFIGTYAEARMATSALRRGQYSVVEGPVTHFVPMPVEGHSNESFVVGNQRFSYSDYTVTAGFRNTASHGGPIREGIQVRVTYVGNLILKLEIAR